MEYPSTRSEAKATGATHYFTGIPCKHGHTALRITKGECTVCRESSWQKFNDQRKLKPKSEASKAAGRRYYLRNKELVKARAMARPVEEKRKHKAKHKKNNPDIYKILVNTRRRRLKDATPSCLTEDDFKAIRLFYSTALELTRLTGINHEVDHRTPIVHDRVCGLHVPWNLEVITEAENQVKSNDF